MPNPQKLLILGFSCTDTDDGYASYLGAKLRLVRPDLHVVRCALGGLAPPVVPGILKQILTKTPGFTHVLLEINTSIYSWLPSSTVVQAKDIIRDIIATAIDSGAQPFFLFLNRKNENEKKIDFDKLLRDECIACDLHYLDLSKNIEHIFGRGWFERHYRDDVHTNEAGGRSQAGVVLPSITAFLDRQNAVTTVRNRPRLTSHATSICELLGKEASGYFARKDHHQPYLTIGIQDKLEINFPNTTLVQGLSFVMGPWSGNFKVDLRYGKTSESRIVSAFDERSYYPRLGYRALKGNEPIAVDALSLSFSDKAEEVKLIKGERAQLPPEIRIVDLFIAE